MPKFDHHLHIRVGDGGTRVSGERQARETRRNLRVFIDDVPDLEGPTRAAAEQFALFGKNVHNAAADDAAAENSDAECTG